MADYVPVLLSFPPTSKVSAVVYDGEIRDFIKEIDKIPRSSWTKTVDKKSLFDILDPAVNTIPYLFALYHHREKVGKDRKACDDLLSQTAIFYQTCDPIQIRYVPVTWTGHFGWTLDALCNTRSTDLSPLSNAILRLDSTAGTFTSYHLLFLRQCLEADVLRQALPVLDKNIYAFPTDPPRLVGDELLCDDHELSCAWLTARSGFSHKLQPDYILEYYLLGAHVYIGLQRYKRARLFLEYILLTPTNRHASELQVEAYNRWILVGLLAEGKQYPIPRTIDQSIIKSIRTLSKAYEALAESFEKRDWRKFEAEADIGTQAWDKDGNLGIVNQVGHALLRYRVLDLQKTYAALPVSRVATHLGFSADETFTLLQNMIQGGFLNASISTGIDVVLRFHLTSTAPANQDEELQAQTKRIEELVSYVREADRKLQLSKEYVEFTKRQKRAAGLDGDLGDAMDTTWDTPGGFPSGGMLEEDDEDMMGDMR